MFQSFWDGFLGLTFLINDDKCHAQGNKTVPNERIEPATLRPRIRQRVVNAIINAVIFKKLDLHHRRLMKTSASLHYPNFG